MLAIIVELGGIFEVNSNCLEVIKKVAWLQCVLSIIDWPEVVALKIFGVPSPEPNASYAHLCLI